MLNCIVVGLGGFVGAICRYFVGLIPIESANGFPIKTLLINIAGAFLIGLVIAFGSKKDWNPQLVLFLKVGFCGGFTTFSSFALETDQLMSRGHSGLAAVYIVLSVVLSVFAVILAQVLVARTAR